MMPLGSECAAMTSTNPDVGWLLPGDSIAVVVDRSFGTRLDALVSHVHTWISDSEENRHAARRVWERGDSCGATVFTGADKAGPETLFLSQLGVIAEHHPDWRAMVVFGVDCTAQIADALREAGVTQFQEYADGFIATRPADAVE